METSKVFNQLILQNLESNGFEGLSEALIILFPYLEEYDGITASQLAKKVGYSRQAMHKNIKKLVELGYITLLQENQKEKSIMLTEKSKKLMTEANRYIAAVEKNIAELIGQEALDQYKTNQTKIYDFLRAAQNG